MIIFLYGPDSYRRQKKANYIIEEYCHKHSNLSLAYFDLDPSTSSGQEFLRLQEFSSQMLIFSALGGNKKLAVLKNAFALDLKILREFLKKYVKTEDLTILISEDNFPAELKSVLSKAFSAEKFELFEGDKWKFFIQKQAKERNINLTSQAVIFLSRVFENDVWGLINELDKISLTLKKTPLDTADFKKISDYDSESPDIYGFINAVSENWPMEEKIINLEKLFTAQEEPAKIFNYMASFRYLPQELIKKLADYDVLVKSGKIDYEEILVGLALSN